MEVLQSVRLLALLKKLRAYFDWIVIDSPPLLPFADTTFWAGFADGVLVVVREGKTQKKILLKGLATLDNPTIVGVVLNGSHKIDQQYYDRYSNSHNAQRKSDLPKGTERLTYR
jgi:Mrp family chromosome partitioning ATPase